MGPTFVPSHLSPPALFLFTLNLLETKDITKLATFKERKKGRNIFGMVPCNCTRSYRARKTACTSYLSRSQCKV